MEHFFSFIQRFGVVPSKDADVLRQYAKSAVLRAGAFFLQPGQVCHRVGFVQEGVMRVYITNEEGREVTRAFPAEQHFMVDLDSYNNQKTSIEHWEAMTDLQFVYWERADVERMEQEIGCWHDILIPMTQHILLSAANERNDMFSDDASTRYRKFVEKYPHIMQRVPLRHIANYLGIAPQSLSRIRQQFGKG